MQTKYCLKIFKNIDNKLTSLYNVYPLTYRRNQWNKAPEGTGLFVYTLESEYLNEFGINREVWLCEYRGLRKENKDYFRNFFRHNSLSSIQKAHKITNFSNQTTYLVDSIKPVEKLNFNSEKYIDEIVIELFSILRKRNNVSI